MHIKSNVGVKAWFKFVVRKADGSVTKDTGWCPNIVLDAGLDQMSRGTWIAGCSVGSGNSEPAVTQTLLDNIVATTATIQEESARWVIGEGSDPTYLSKLRRYRFGEGAAQGNLSEVSMGWYEGSVTTPNFRCWNRALILDGEGKPTTLTVLPDEFLDVFTELRMYPAMVLSGQFDLVDKNNQVISSHTLTGKPYIPNSTSFGRTTRVSTTAASTYSGGLSESLSGNPTGLLHNLPASNVHSEYPNPRTCRAIAVFGLNSSNGDIKSFRQNFDILGGASQWGYNFEVEPIVPKNSAQILTFVSEITWGRYTGG